MIAGGSLTAMTVTTIVSVFRAPVGSVAVSVPSVEPDHSVGAETKTSWVVSLM